MNPLQVLLLLSVLMGGSFCSWGQFQSLYPHQGRDNPGEEKEERCHRPPLPGLSSISSSSDPPAQEEVLLQEEVVPQEEVLGSSQEVLLVSDRLLLRPDWCKTQPLQQLLRAEGCRSRTVLNRFCYGQCNSFYIPGHEDAVTSTGTGSAFRSCSACRPRSFSTVSYTLLCPGRTPGTHTKRVQRVKQCRCTTVPTD